MKKIAILSIISLLLSGCADLSNNDDFARIIERDGQLICRPEEPERCAIGSHFHFLADKAGLSADFLHYVILFDSGEDELLARLHLIRSARRSIVMQQFISSDFNTTSKTGGWKQPPIGGQAKPEPANATIDLVDGDVACRAVHVFSCREPFGNDLVIPLAGLWRAPRAKVYGRAVQYGIGLARGFVVSQFWNALCMSVHGFPFQKRVVLLPFF